MVVKAYFAGGCFWGMQYYFARIKGVVGSTVGFMGGNVANPSYKLVRTGTTAHLETIEVSYDNTIVGYEALVRFFFEIHDFEQADGQGIDIGSQYLSAIFYSDENEKTIAQKVISELTGMGYKPATQIRPKEEFYRAEDYHQFYLDQRREMPECHVYRRIFKSGNITLTDKSTMMGMAMPHKIFFDGRLLGIMQKKEIRIEGIPVGTHKVKIQSMIPFISTEADIKVGEGENRITFHDREKFWDWLFTIDLIMVIVQWIVTLPTGIKTYYNIATDAIFAIWLAYEWLNRKKYFKIEKQ